MQTNVAHLDRALRLGAGLFLLATPILDLDTYPANLLGVVLLATGVFGFCPLYAALRAIAPKGRPSMPAGTHGFGQLGGAHERPAR